MGTTQCEAVTGRGLRRGRYLAVFVLLALGGSTLACTAASTPEEQLAVTQTQEWWRQTIEANSANLQANFADTFGQLATNAAINLQGLFFLLLPSILLTILVNATP